MMAAIGTKKSFHGPFLLRPVLVGCGGVRRRIRTNNPLERLNREIRRRTRVVGAFPDGHSAVMLISARLRHVAGTTWGTKRYLNLDHLNAHATTTPTLEITA